VDFKQLFEDNDEDDSGDLNIDEFRRVMKDLGFVMSDSILELIIERFDEDKTGAVDYIEFLTFFAPHVLKNLEEKLAAAGDPEPMNTLLGSRAQRNKSQRAFAFVNAFTNGTEVDHVRELAVGHGHAPRHIEKRIEEVVGEKIASLQELLQHEIRALAKGLGVNTSAAKKTAKESDSPKATTTRTLAKGGRASISLPSLPLPMERSISSQSLTEIGEVEKL
jgi:hypothetical protein